MPRYASASASTAARRSCARLATISWPVGCWRGTSGCSGKFNLQLLIALAYFLHLAITGSYLRVMAINDTTYAVTYSAGGLEGLGTLWVPIQDLSFWPLSATFVADSGQKEEFSGAAKPHPNPH